MTVNIGQLAASTLRNRRGIAADNIQDNIAVLKYILESDTKRYEDGGRDIVEQVEYAEQNFGWYTGWDQLNVGPVDSVDGANYDWKQASASMSISGREQRMNSGKHASIRLVKQKVKGLEKTMMNNMSTAIFGDGTGSNGLTLLGLQALVSTTPSTGNPGGIDRSVAANAFWRNYAFSGVTTGGAAVSPANIQAYMNQCWLNTMRGTDQTKLITADNNYYDFYWRSLQAIQRITDGKQKKASIGFESLAFKNADVICGGGIGGAHPANKMYFLNTDYLGFVIHPDADFEVIGGDRTPINQDGFTRIMLFMGALTMSGGQFQAVLFA